MTTNTLALVRAHTIGTAAPVRKRLFKTVASPVRLTPRREDTTGFVSVKASRLTARWVVNDSSGRLECVWREVSSDPDVLLSGGFVRRLGLLLSIYDRAA